MSVSAPASWSKSQNPYRTAPARRQRRHLVSLRDVRSQTPCVGDRSGLVALAGGSPSGPAASPQSAAATPLCRRARELSDIDPKYVSQSGLCLSSDMETSRGSIRIQHLTGGRPPPVGEPRFPKLHECAHFHYEIVELGPLLVQLYDEELKSASHVSDEEPASYLSLQVTSFGRSWVLRRTYDNLRLLDTQLHQCVYDRKYSCLPELPLEENLAPIDDSLQEAVEALVADYLHRFSQIAGPLINCAPILNWFELDNRGNRLLVADDSDINTPAVAAALVGKRYVAQASDEISLEVGDMISVIDMAPPDESVWWRGKRGFEVGFFPCECVELIGEKVPSQLEVSVRPRRSATLQQQPSRPVLRKHGKLIAFFRSFIQTRPSRRKLKQSGILKERVFGCDLGEHLMNTGRDIPMVLRSCAEFIEAHGIVDGIYRLSGVNSNIQRLRNTFDEDRVPDLADPSVRQDIHSVSCLLKQYLRELPNPLLTYQLYDKFVSAVQSSDDQRLLRMHDVVQQLPPPHYRTLEYLIRHLFRVSAHGHDTGMTPKNLAIVWAPNLVRSKELEVGGVAALQGVGIQAVVVEYLIRYCELIFSDKLPAFCPELAPQARTPKRSRPKSLAISTPTKLLSLEEARSRALGVSAKPDQKYIEVGGGPSQLPTKYHTVIELPPRKTGSLKSRRSPIAWKTLFRGRPTKTHQRKGSEPIDIGLTDKTLTESDLTQSRLRTRRLRSVKSADSLVSLCHAESKRSSMLLDSSPSPATLPASAPAADPLTLRSCSESDTQETDPMVRAHARSVSHDSYFNNLLELKLPFCDAEERLEEEDEELQTQYCFDDSDMRVFSEDETMRASDSTGWKGRIRQLTSPPRVRRATRSEEGGVKRTATGSFRDKVLSALSPGARRRAEEVAAEAGGSPRVKVRKKASVETLTCSESTSVDISSLRTDGSAAGVLSEGETQTPPAAAPAAAGAPLPAPPAAPAPAGRQVVAEVHVSPEPSTCQDIILLSPISECTASSAEHYGRPSASSPAEDVTEHDVSEIADSDGALTPAADDNRISTLVPEALELLDRRLNSESFLRAVADAAASGDQSSGDAFEEEDADYENISPVEPAGGQTSHEEDIDASYEPVVFRAGDADSSDVGLYENAAFASAAEVWQPRHPSSVGAGEGDGDELLYENVTPSSPPDAVYQQVQVFRSSLQEVNALVGSGGGSDSGGGGGGAVAGELAAVPARRSFVESAVASSADRSSPTRSCPAFSDGTPSPTDVRYSQLSSTASSPERRLVSADITTAATCSDTLDERPLPSEADLAELAAPAPHEAVMEHGVSAAEVGGQDVEVARMSVTRSEDHWEAAVAPVVASPPGAPSLQDAVGGGDLVSDAPPVVDREDSREEVDTALEMDRLAAGGGEGPVTVTVTEDEPAVCGPETVLRLCESEGDDGRERPAETEDPVCLPEETSPSAADPRGFTAELATDLRAAAEDLIVQGEFTSPMEGDSVQRDLLHRGFPTLQSDDVSPDPLSPSPLPPPSPDGSEVSAENSGDASGLESPPPASSARPAGDSGLGTPEDGMLGAAPASPSRSERSSSAERDDLPDERAVADVVKAEPVLPARPVELVTDETPAEGAAGDAALTAEEAAVTRPRAASQTATAAVCVPGRETERRPAGARAAASWPSPTDGGSGGGQRAADPAPVWLRSDLRRLSDRRASVKQLLSKFEVKEEEEEVEAGDEDGDVFVGHASEMPARTTDPGRESVLRKTSLPERPRYLFSPKPFQRQLSDQSATRPRPEALRASPLTSPASGAAVRITENPLHVAAERLARSATEPTEAPRTNGVREASPAAPPLRVGSVPSQQQLRVGCVPSRLSDLEPALPTPAASGNASVANDTEDVSTTDAPTDVAAPAAEAVTVTSPAADGEWQEGHQANPGVVEGRLVVELDADARERIERYKQERRSLLREKFKTESFKREKTEVMQELRRPESERRADEVPQSPSPTRRGVLRRSDSEAAERRAARPAVVSAPPVAAPFRRAASLRSPSQETAVPLTTASATAPAAAASPSSSVNDRLAAARERVSQLKNQEVAAALARSPPAGHDVTEEVNVKEQVSGWGRGQRGPAAAGGRRTPATVTPTTPTRLAPRGQLPDPGKIRNIAAKFEETSEGTRKGNYVSTV